MSVVSVVCWQVKVSATSWSFFHRSPSVNGVTSLVLFLNVNNEGAVES